MLDLEFIPTGDANSAIEDCFFDDSDPSSERTPDSENCPVIELPVSRQDKPKKTAVAYIRVSTEDQNLGPGAQRDSIQQWADREGVQIIAWFDDHGVSGAAALDQRPELASALSAISAEKADMLIVAKRDRLARDALLAGFLEKEVARSGATIISAAGEGNGDAPQDKLMRQIIDAFSQYEREIIRARTKNAIAQKRKLGEHHGNAPWGMRLRGPKLIAHAGEQAISNRVHQLRAQGVTIRQIVAELEASGVTSPRTDNPVGKSTVETILKQAS